MGHNPRDAENLSKFQCAKPPDKFAFDMPVKGSVLNDP
jgi:hypothetical protein